MATLVTGGTGFIGSNIVRALAERRHEVVSFDLVAPDALVRKYVAPWAGQVTFVQGDILDPGDLERAMEGRGITKIVHAAVFTGVRPDVERDRSRSIVDINLAGTSNLLDLACKLPLERFLYVSSRSVYGEGRSPGDTLREDDVPNPWTLYALTKYTSELLTRRYGQLHGFQTVSVRLGGPYGPMERVTGHRVLMSEPFQWTGNVVRGEPLRVSDRAIGRDYTYVADIAAGICTILDAPSITYDVYNNSAGRWITAQDLIDTLKSLNPSLEVIDDASEEVISSRPRAAQGVTDVTWLREDLGFKASYDLASGIREYLRWREESGFKD